MDFLFIKFGGYVVQADWFLFVDYDGVSVGLVPGKMDDSEAS